MILAQWSAKKRLFGGLGIVLLLLIGGIVIFVVRKNTDSTNPISEAQTQASDLTTKGDYDQALQALKGVDTKKLNTAQKVELFSDLAAASTNTGQLSDALDYYSQKHQLAPDTAASDGYLVGEIYERQGDIPKAIEQFELYLTFVKAHPPEETGQATIENMQTRIDQLKEGQ